MAKEIMTFEQLPKAVSELTTQVMELRDMVAALKPTTPDEKHRIVGIDEACIITHKTKPTISYPVPKQTDVEFRELLFPLSEPCLED